MQIVGGRTDVAETVEVGAQRDGELAAGAVVEVGEFGDPRVDEVGVLGQQRDDLAEQHTGARTAHGRDVVDQVTFEGRRVEHAVDLGAQLRYRGEGVGSGDHGADADPELPVRRVDGDPRPLDRGITGHTGQDNIGAVADGRGHRQRTERAGVQGERGDPGGVLPQRNRSVRRSPRRETDEHDRDGRVDAQRSGQRLDVDDVAPRAEEAADHLVVFGAGGSTTRDHPGGHRGRSGEHLVGVVGEGPRTTLQPDDAQVLARAGRPDRDRTAFA